MTDDILPFEKSRDMTLSRRGFAALSLAAPTALTSAAKAAAAVTETDVTVNTPDGVCDAALFHPTGATARPGAVIFVDALGLRPAFRDMGRALAGEGYTVLVPNPYYRARKAPVLAGPFDFNKPEDRAKLTELRAGIDTAAKKRDALAYIAFLDGLGQVNTKKKIGVSGYCMGGAYTMIAAAAAPDRVGAGGSFHGGALVTDQPDSPHLLVPQMKASFYFGVAANDDAKEPNAKVALREAFDAAKLPAKIEVYSTSQHGWCVSDGAVYNKAEADRAFGELRALYKQALA